MQPSYSLEGGLFVHAQGKMLLFILQHHLRKYYKNLNKKRFDKHKYTVSASIFASHLK